MQGTITAHSQTLNFMWERNGDWFYAEIFGPFNLKLASVIGNQDIAIWTSLLSEKQTVSQDLLKKIMGQPYPIHDFFNILCGQNSQMLTTQHHKQQTHYSNQTVSVIAKDFNFVGDYHLPLEIIINGPDYETSIWIDQLELGYTPAISSAINQSQIKRIRALPPSPAP